MAREDASGQSNQEGNETKELEPGGRADGCANNHNTQQHTTTHNTTHNNTQQHPTTHQQHTNNTPTTHQQHTNNTPTTHQQHTNNTPTPHQHHTNTTPTPHHQRDNHHAAEEEGAKPTWEVLETTSTALSFHSCDVEPNASPGTLDKSSETTQKPDTLRWPHRAVSRE